MKYIIDLEPIAGTDLYKAKGFNTLVFDGTGINKLKRYDEGGNTVNVGDTFRTPNGNSIYKLVEHINDGKNNFFNCINLTNGKYVSMPAKDNVVIVSREGE